MGQDRPRRGAKCSSRRAVEELYAVQSVDVGWQKGTGSPVEYDCGYRIIYLISKIIIYLFFRRRKRRRWRRCRRWSASISGSPRSGKWSARLAPFDVNRSTRSSSAPPPNRNVPITTTFEDPFGQTRVTYLVQVLLGHVNMYVCMCSFWAINLDYFALHNSSKKLFFLLISKNENKYFKIIIVSLFFFIYITYCRENLNLMLATAIGT